MSQRFVNQKLGKRMSRKAQLQKAKAQVWQPRAKDKKPAFRASGALPEKPR